MALRTVSWYLLYLGFVSSMEIPNKGENLELTNAEKVENLADFPYLGRMRVRTPPTRTKPPSYHICGSSLITENIMITAKHCVTLDTFYDGCIRESDCYVDFRDLNRDHYEQGQFRVPIINAFTKPGASDLAVIVLKHSVREHPDYSDGPALRPVKLATEEPRIGEMVVTAGWGQTGYGQGLSQQLRKLSLTVSSTSPLWVHTSVREDGLPHGQLTDPCKGDSGGPLVIWRNGEWEIVGTLKVGYSETRSLIVKQDPDH